MPIQRNCIVTDVQRLYDGCFRVTSDMGPIAREARPGQFIHVAVGGAHLLRRPISICRVNGDLLTFVFEIRGEGTRELSKCRVGDGLDVLGPLGHGFTLTGGKTLIVGGGIGVPPMLETAAACPGEVTAILGFRDSGRMCLTEEFEAVCARTFVVTDDGSNGHAGPVTVPMRELLADERFDSVLCCGPRPMLKAVAALCFDADLPCQVSMEQRMGCGVGACLVCSCRTRKDGAEHMSRVCADGPVFDAREVVWDD